MNKLLPTAIKILLLIALAFVIPVSHAYATPSILFDKTSVSALQNTTFTVTINVNVDASSAQSSKATIQYAPADLDVVSVSDGHFFPSFAQANDPTNGILEITGYNTSAGAGSTGNGQLATITFKAKKSSGSSNISFGCNGGGHDTNILTTAGQNILTCTQTNTLGASYTGASTPTPTPTPVGPTPTPTPAQGPNTTPVCANLAADVTSAVGTPLAVTFTCSGVDTDGYINAAYFDFGDDTHDTISKNVGSPGAISTTHTYTTIGALGVSCRVQDNNQVWSQVPDVCKKIVKIDPKPRTIGKPAAPANTALTPTPTPQQMTLVLVTPTATPSPSLTPTPAPAKPFELFTNLWLLIASIGAILLGLIISLLGGKKTPPPTPHA